MIDEETAALREAWLENYRDHEWLGPRPDIDINAFWTEIEKTFAWHRHRAGYRLEELAKTIRENFTKEGP